MKNLYYKLIIVLTIGFVCLFLSFSSASALFFLNSLPAFDGIKIFPGGVCINAVPRAGDDMNDRRIVARLVFDLTGVCLAGFTGSVLEFNVIVNSGAPFADLGGNLNVRVRGWDLFSPCVTGGRFLTNVAGPGPVAIDNACPNIWKLNLAISNACVNFANPALIVILDFPSPSDSAGDPDSVVIPSASASLTVF